MTLRSKPAALGLGAALIFGDAFVLNQGIISFMIAAWIVLFRIPRILLADKYRADRKQWLQCQAIYLASAMAVIALNAANNHTAQRRGEKVVAAIEAYREQNHKYPQQLADLVPGQLAEVPAAKFCMGFNTFWYVPTEKDPVFFYVQLPPFGRRAYSFTKKEWYFFD